MDTNYFLQAYRLKQTSNFPYERFLKDFYQAFDDVLDITNGLKDMKSFRFCINTMRAMWDNINREAYRPLPEFLWRQFYRNKVCLERQKVPDFNYKIVRCQAEKAIKNKKPNF